MNIEVEIAVSLRDTDAFRKSVKELGAVYQSTKRQVDQYFTRNDENFREQSRYLRICVEDEANTGRLEYHVGKTDFSAEEREIEVNDVVMTEEILLQVGFIKTVRVDKTRETWKYDDFTIVIDQLAGAGDYAEVELMNEDEQQAEARIMELLKQLDYDKSDIPEMQNYYDIVLEQEK